MELVLTRIAKRKTYTIGRLAIAREVNDEYRTYQVEDYFCDTLEPTWRNYAAGAHKVQGCSAIPEGRYAVVISWSPKFSIQPYLPMRKQKSISLNGLEPLRILRNPLHPMRRCWKS